MQDFSSSHVVPQSQPKKQPRLKTLPGYHNQSNKSVDDVPVEGEQCQSDTFPLLLQRSKIPSPPSMEANSSSDVENEDPGPPQLPQRTKPDKLVISAAKPTANVVDTTLNANLSPPLSISDLRNIDNSGKQQCEKTGDHQTSNNNSKSMNNAAERFLGHVTADVKNPTLPTSNIQMINYVDKKLPANQTNEHDDIDESLAGLMRNGEQMDSLGEKRKLRPGAVILGFGIPNVTPQLLLNSRGNLTRIDNTNTTARGGEEGKTNGKISPNVSLAKNSPKFTTSKTPPEVKTSKVCTSPDIAVTRDRPLAPLSTSPLLCPTSERQDQGYSSAEVTVTKDRPPAPLPTSPLHCPSSEKQDHLLNSEFCLLCSYLL